MATEAETPESIQSNKIGEEDMESRCGDSESFKEMQKVEDGLDLHAKITENLTKTENQEMVSNVNNDIVSCVVESDVGSCEGESFLVSPSLAKVAIENTSIASESTALDGKKILQQKETLDNETQLQKDLKQEGVEEVYGIFNAFVKQVLPDPGLKSDVKPAKLPELSSEKNVEETGLQKRETEEPPLNIDEDRETEKKKVILAQEVETKDERASTIELSHDTEQEKAVDHSQEDEIEGQISSKEGTIDFMDIREPCIKDTSRDYAPIKQEVEESGFEGVQCKGQEKSSNTEGKEAIVNPSEKIWEKKQDGHENPQDNNPDSVLKAEEIIDSSDGTDEKYHIQPTKFITEETSLDKSEQESGNIEQLSSIALEEKSKETEDSNEALKDVNPSENENPNDDLEVPLVAKETRLNKSEQEAGKFEETSSSELEEKSQEIIDSNGKMKPENPVECELPSTEDLESPLVTLETEGSHFQEQPKPDKIEETSETESITIGKDNCSEAEPQDELLETAKSTISEGAKHDENPTKLDASSITDEEGLEGLQRGSENPVFPLTNASIDENKNKGGSSDTETRDNAEVNDGDKENYRWKMPKDVEASEQSLQTDKPDEEKLEKSLSESVEPAASSADAETSTCKKEEESINSVEESSKEMKERNVNWDDEAREQRTSKDENLRTVDSSQKIENMEVETQNMEMGNSPAIHSLVEETTKQPCEQQEEVSNLEVEEQVHEESKNTPVKNKHIEGAFGLEEHMESTMLQQEKTRDSAQTWELIPQVSEMEVETVKVCGLDSQEKSTDTDASEKREEQTEKNEASEIGMSKTVTEGEVEKIIIMEDCCIPDQGTVFCGNKTDNQTSQVEDKMEAPEFSGEDQSCNPNDIEKVTKNEIINKEVSAEPKIIGVDEETEKHIIEESTIVAHSKETMKEPLKKSSQEDEIMKKDEEEIHKGPHTECEVLEQSSTGENIERQTVTENSTVSVKDHSPPTVQEETAPESTHEDEVSERVETTGAGEETERSILEEYGAVKDNFMLSVVGTTVRGSSKEDEKEEEKPKEFPDSEGGTLKNMEDTNMNDGASGVTEASGEEMLQKERVNGVAGYEEESKVDLEKAENNNEKLEAEFARTLQEAEQEEKLLLDGSNLAPKNGTVVTTETSSTSFQHVDVKTVKLEETHNQSENAKEDLKVEKQDADEGNKGKDCEMKMEYFDPVVEFHEGVELTTETEIQAKEAPLDNRWEETLQGPSTLAPEGQELDSIEKSEETKDASPMQQNNLEFPHLANSTGEISIQKEGPGKLEDISKMSTNETGKEGSNEELQEANNAKEKKLSDSYPEKNISESKYADEILKREEATELTNLGKNSRTETLKDECKLQESPEEVELDGEKIIDVVSKDVELSSLSASIEKDVLDKEDHVSNFDEIPEEGRIGSEKVEDVGIKLEAGDQNQEINKGFDPRESTALQENTEDVDPSQKLEREYVVMAEDQSHETLPEAKEKKAKEDNSVVEDQNTAYPEEQMIIQRLQETEEDGMNLEDIRHKLEAELQTGKEPIPNENINTAILNEVAHCGHDKVETSQNIRKWSTEGESTAKDLHIVSIEDRTVNEVQDSVRSSSDMCTQQIDDHVETETLHLKTAEYPSKKAEASPITEVLEGDKPPRQASEEILDISKSVPEVSEEMIKEYIFKEVETSNDKLSIASFTATKEEMSSQENEPESSKLEGSSDIGSEEKCQRTVEASSMDEEVNEVKLAQTPDSVIQLPTEGKNAHEEKTKTLEKIDPYEVEEIKGFSNAVSASEYQAVMATTEAETKSNRPAMVEESEKILHEPPVSGSEQELENKNANQTIRDELLEEDEPLEVKNSVGPFTREETENMCLQRNEPKELEQASKIGFQDIEKGSPNEEQEKTEGQKVDDASQLHSEIPAFAAYNDESSIERERNIELKKASNVCRIETSSKEGDEKLVSDSQKEESDGKKLEIPFDKMSGEHDEDGAEVDTEEDSLEKDDHAKSPTETLEEETNASDTKEKAEISHLLSKEQEKETPPSMDKIDTSKLMNEADKDLDASPTHNLATVEATKEEAVNEPQEATQLVPKELIHAINGTNDENREGAPEDKNVVKELIEVHKPNNTSSNLVSNPGDIVEDLPPTDKEYPPNDSNTSSFTEASQEQAPEKGSQMLEDEGGLTLEFTKQATGEVKLPKEAMEGDPVIDEGAVKESSNKEAEKMNNDRYFHETNANEEGETLIPGQQNMAVFSSVEQAATERSFKDDTEQHDRTTNAVIKEQDLYIPCVGEEMVKDVCRDEMEVMKVDKITTLEDEDKSQALEAIEDQGEKINAAKETPNHEILNEDVSEELEADASANWGEQIKEEAGMVKDSFPVAMGEETYKECHEKDEKDRNKVDDSKIKLDLEDMDTEEDQKDEAMEANKITECETLHEEVPNGFEDYGPSEKMESQVTEKDGMKDPLTVGEDHEGEKKDSQEVRSSDVISVKQQLEKTPLTVEAETSTIEGKADVDLAALPTTSLPAAEATEEDAVNEPRRVTQPVPKGLIHGINETSAENIQGAAEDKYVMKELIDVQKPTNTSSILVSNPGDNVEGLHPTDQEVPTNDSNASSFTEASQEQAPEKGSQMTEDDQGQTLESTIPATGEVNLPKEAKEGDPVKDEGAEKESSNKEAEKMNNDMYFHETTASEGGETPIPGQENMAVMVIEEQTQVTNHNPQHVDERATTLEAEDKSQATIGAQEEKANAANETLNCEIFNEDVSSGLNKDGASATKGNQIMEENGMVKEACPASIGEETYKESQHEDEKEGDKVNDPKTKLELEDQSQELDAEEVIKDQENEANMTTKCGTSNEEVSNGFENAGSSETMERQMTEEEATKDLYLVPTKEETVSKDNEEAKDSQEAEKDKSSDVVLEEQQLEKTHSNNEADATTVKDEAFKDHDASPTPHSPAEEAVNEPKEVTQLVLKELIHEINKTNEENKEGDTVEYLHPNDQEVQTNNSNVSSFTESSQERISEKEGHMTEDERCNLVIPKQATAEVNLPTEKTEGDSIKDEVQAQDTIYKECEKMNDYSNVQETTCGYEGGETLLQEQEDTVFFSSVGQATAEKSIKDSPKEHDTTTNLLIEEQGLLTEPYKEGVGEEKVEMANQDNNEGERVDEMATELDAKDKIQASEAIEDQMEKIIETNDIPKCEILKEEVPRDLEQVDTTENIEKQNMEANGTIKDPCKVSIGEEACKECHHKDKKEGKSVNDREIKLHLEDQSKEELAGEDPGDIANESNKTVNHETISYEVSLGTENAGSSEKEETTKKAHPEEEKEGLEDEKEAKNWDPKNQNHETSSQNDATKNHILDEKELETTASTEKMDIVTIKEDLDGSSTLNIPDKEASVGGGVYEPQEAPHYEPTELIRESIITNEENTENTSEDKIVAKEFIEVGELKTNSSDFVSHPSNNVEELHPKDQEVPANISSASSLAKASQAKTPEKEADMTEDEERKSLVMIKQEKGETSLATGQIEGFPINNEAPVEETLKKEGEEMNDAGANISNWGGETPAPKWQERATFSSTEQAIAENSIRDSPELLDTTGNLVFDEQSHEKTSSMHEVQQHETEKTKGQNLEDADTLNEKVSLSGVQPSDRELLQKVERVNLPEVTEISTNIGKLEKAADATTEESTQTKIRTGEEDIPSVSRHSIAKSKQGDEVEDQRPEETLGTESREKGEEYTGDTTMGDVKPMHKKSHNILSGVGSKVMHSIAKVKKVIACTHPLPNSEPPSPK